MFQSQLSLQEGAGRAALRRDQADEAISRFERDGITSAARRHAAVWIKKKYPAANSRKFPRKV